MPLEELCEPSITHSTSFSINTPKSRNDVVVIHLTYPVLMLHSGDSLTALPVLLVPPLSARQSHFLTTSSSLLPPPTLPFILINIHPSTKNNKNNTYYDYLIPSHFALRRDRHPLLRDNKNSM